MPRKRESSSYKSVSSKKRKKEEQSKSLIRPELDLTNVATTSPEKNVSLSTSKMKEVKRGADCEAVLVEEDQVSPANGPKKAKVHVDDDDDEPDARFFGLPVPDEEARRRWPNRYQAENQKQVGGLKSTKNKEDSAEIIQARRHYLQAEVDKCVVYDLYDDAHVKAGDGEESYICKIVEMFEGVDGNPYFNAQWYYRAKDTVIKKLGHLIDNKRVFFSEIRDDNSLDCLLEKLKIARIPLHVGFDAKKASIPVCNYYCDMLYSLPYSSFVALPTEDTRADSETVSTISSDGDGSYAGKSADEGVSQNKKLGKSEVRLLDLYAGCGAMSTGLCLGANDSGLNLVTKWAIDLNKYACDSLKLNHPETEVRNESVEDFLSLLKEWEKLCIGFSLIKGNNPQLQKVDPFGMKVDKCGGDDDEDGSDDVDQHGDSEVFEVERILEIRYGDPNESGERGLYFKVQWKGYGAEYDSWEPLEGLGNCGETMKNFVMHGFKSKILPLPGDVDVICGGPPCQGISGFNRFRNKDNPLDDEKNKQLLVYMEVVEYLKPKFVLMENVVDILKFSDGFLGRYALGRLIGMNYQTRMGMMAAGAYGLPQFRMRFFLWGARPTEKLPQYPLPTHDVVVRGGVPVEFEMNTVAYEEGHRTSLGKKLLLKDAIYDLPSVENNEPRDEIPYDKDPETSFQQFIRLRKYETLGASKHSKATNHMLYDHRSLELNTDDYQRVCQIPKKKGANFRDLTGVRVRPDKKVEWDPDIARVYLDSGKPLVPDYAMSFMDGSSSKPFARLWWDETVPTVVTRAEPHNQAIIHPEQDRVLSVRENARLQGFPDYYQLCGPVKERYIQVGNAVAVPVARALGYSLGLAYQRSATAEPLFTLPPNFPSNIERLSSASTEDDA